MVDFLPPIKRLRSTRTKNMYTQFCPNPRMAETHTDLVSVDSEDAQPAAAQMQNAAAVVFRTTQQNLSRHLLWTQMRKPCCTRDPNSCIATALPGAEPPETG